MHREWGGGGGEERESEKGEGDTNRGAGYRGGWVERTCVGVGVGGGGAAKPG